MQVAHVACNVERGDLPLTVEHLVVSGNQSLYDETRAIDCLTWADDIVVRSALLFVPREAKHRLPFYRRESGAMQQPLKELR
jgi:hypothetical protein